MAEQLTLDTTTERPRAHLVEVVGQCHGPGCGAEWNPWTDRPCQPGEQQCPSCLGYNTTEELAAVVGVSEA